MAGGNRANGGAAHADNNWRDNANSNLAVRLVLSRNQALDSDRASGVVYSYMTQANFAFLPTKTKRIVKELSKELDLKDQNEFVRRAVEDKILDLRRAAFFSVSDRVAGGLRRKGLRAADILRKFKS